MPHTVEEVCLPTTQRGGVLYRITHPVCRMAAAAAPLIAHGPGYLDACAPFAAPLLPVTFLPLCLPACQPRVLAHAGGWRVWWTNRPPALQFFWSADSAVKGETGCGRGRRPHPHRPPLPAPPPPPPPYPHCGPPSTPPHTALHSCLRFAPHTRSLPYPFYSRTQLPYTHLLPAPHLPIHIYLPLP